MHEFKILRQTTWLDLHHRPCKLSIGLWSNFKYGREKNLVGYVLNGVLVLWKLCLLEEQITWRANVHSHCCFRKCSFHTHWRVLEHPQESHIHLGGSCHGWACRANTGHQMRTYAACPATALQPRSAPMICNIWAPAKCTTVLANWLPQKTGTKIGVGHRNLNGWNSPQCKALNHPVFTL